MFRIKAVRHDVTPLVRKLQFVVVNVAVNELATIQHISKSGGGGE